MGLLLDVVRLRHTSDRSSPRDGALVAGLREKVP